MAVSQGELGAATVRGHSVNAECLGLLNILEQPLEDLANPLSRLFLASVTCSILDTALQYNWFSSKVSENIQVT